MIEYAMCLTTKIAFLKNIGNRAVKKSPRKFRMKNSALLARDVMASHRIGAKEANPFYLGFLNGFS